MNFKAIAVAATAVGVASLELLNLYKQVMGRNDRIQMPVTKIATKEDAKQWEKTDKWAKPYYDWAEQQNPEKCTISSRGNLLRGYYWAPKNESKVIVIGSHGFHADHTKDPYTFIKHYHDKGYGFFCPDHVASSSSGGNYVGFDYYESIDMLKWIDYLTARFGKDITIILHGVSMGAATVLQLAGANCPDCVKLIISDCAYTSAKDEFSYVAKGAGVKNPKPVLWLFNEMNKRLAGFDLQETDVRESVKNSKVPILFIHGSADTFVPTKMAYELYNLCPRGMKELKIIDGAYHAQSLYTAEDEYLKTVDNFIDTRLK